MEDYKKYIEDYKKHLTDFDQLYDLLNEAKVNYRVQKLLVVYILKDKEIFKSFVNMSQNDYFAYKLFNHLKYLIDDCVNENIDIYSDKVKCLCLELASNLDYSFLSYDDNFKEDYQNWKDGYLKMLNNYIVEKRLEVNSNWIDEELKNIDYSKLIV